MGPSRYAAPPPDWLPYVNKIMTSGGGQPPDIVVSVIAGTKFNVGLYSALKRAGYKGVLTDATSYDAAILKDPATARALAKGRRIVWIPWTLKPFFVGMRLLPQWVWRRMPR